MFNLFELPELIDLLSGKKREEKRRASPTSLFYGGFFFGLVGAFMGVKLASKIEAGYWIEYVLMLIAAVIGYQLFLTAWRRFLG